jgi:hypothetical protein
MNFSGYKIVAKNRCPSENRRGVIDKPHGEESGLNPETCVPRLPKATTRLSHSKVAPSSPMDAETRNPKLETPNPSLQAPCGRSYAKAEAGGCRISLRIAITLRRLKPAATGFRKGLRQSCAGE